jgi:hypothetical protein
VVDPRLSHASLFLHYTYFDARYVYVPLYRIHRGDREMEVWLDSTQVPRASRLSGTRNESVLSLSQRLRA